MRILKSSGIALWDVLASCERETSLDSHIRKETANDFASFFAQHPHITQVFFNGSQGRAMLQEIRAGKTSIAAARTSSTTFDQSGSCRDALCRQAASVASSFELLRQKIGNSKPLQERETRGVFKYAKKSRYLGVLWHIAFMLFDRLSFRCSPWRLTDRWRSNYDD